MSDLAGVYTDLTVDTGLSDTYPLVNGEARRPMRFLEKIGAGRWAPWVGMALVLGLSVWWRAANLNAFGIFNDEGTYLMWAKHLLAGHPLYSETRAVQGPLFLEALAAGFRWLGVSVAAGRWVSILFGLGALLAVGWLGRALAGRGVALVALTLLSITPLFFAYSRAALAEVMAIAVTLLALGLALHYRQGARLGRAWLLAAGLALAVSFLMKALYPLLPLLVAWLIVERRAERDAAARWRAALVDGLYFAAGLVAPLLLAFVIWDAAGLYDTLVTFRLDLRAAHPLDLGENLGKVGAFLGSNGALVALAAAGLGWLWQRRSRQAAWLPIWLALTLVTVLGHTPLFPHHLLTLLPPLALLAGIGLVWSLAGLGRWRAESAPGRAWTALGLAATGFYLASLPAIVTANNAARQITTGGREAEAIAFLQEVTRPADYLLSDNLMLVFQADRQTPPPLGDVAQVAINAGRLTSEDLIALSQAYDVQAVASWSLRLPWLAAFEAWAEENYLVRRAWDDHHVIYFGRRWPAGAPIPNERRVALGPAILWRGFSLDAEPARTGSLRALPVTLFWEARSKPAADYTVFVQVLDAAGRRVAGWDSQPLHGYLPTSGWPPGEVVRDRLAVPLPADLPPGRYTVIAGMYDLATLERLPVGDTGQDFVVLTEIGVGGR